MFTSATLLDPIFISGPKIVYMSGTLAAHHISDHELFYCYIKDSNLCCQLRDVLYITASDIFRRYLLVV